MTTIGPRIAAGRTSDLHAFGAGSVVKIPRIDVPEHWTPMEASFAAAVAGVGIDTPKVLDVIDVDGRPSIVFEYIEGPTMWERMVTHPGDVVALSLELATIHRAILSAPAPDGLEATTERMRRKIADARQLPEVERAEATIIAEHLPTGACVNHGDLHPGNVLLGPCGPVVIDWFDASVGHGAGDVVRTTLLVRPSRSAGSYRHLPGATAEVMSTVQRTYLEEMADLLDLDGPTITDWVAVAAVSRLAEGAEPDDELLRIWASRGEPAALVSTLSRTAGDQLRE